MSSPPKAPPFKQKKTPPKTELHPNMSKDHNFILFFTTLLTIAFSSSLSASTDTLTATQSLTNNQTLVSPGQVFELGFFSPGNSGNWFVGIWYKDIPVRTVVWVANRDDPLTDSSAATLKLDGRNIVLLGQSQSSLWSTNITLGANNSGIIAQLLDSGNLVLKESSNAEDYLWQSFDFPTDTLLPEMKLGWDLSTGFERHMTSWNGADDPSTGDYSFKVDFHGFPEVYLWEKQSRTYRSGPWNGVRFSGVPEMKPIDYIKFLFVANQSEVYYQFLISSRNLLSRLVINPSGTLQRLTWIPDSEQWNVFWYAPKDQCDNYGECGPYGICDTNTSPVCQCPRGFSPKNMAAWNLRDGSDGCVRRTQLGCGSDGFMKISNMKLAESTTAVVERRLSLKECEAMCLRNCSCTGYANADIRNGGTGCVMWFENLFDLRVYAAGGQDLYLRLAASDLGDGGRGRATIIGITTGVGVLLLAIVSCFIWKMKLFKFRKKNRNEQKGHLEKSQDFLLDEVVISSKREYSGENNPDEVDLPLFDFQTLVTATSNFSEENKLGQGGFGSVYKGRLVEGQDIAVKRLSKNSGQGVEEFKNELRLIARLQHINLVRLLGCCVDIDEKMIIYEYMENRSLDSALFNKERSHLLSWERRFCIICGIARGLLYLHQDSRFRIIHRDLKASNILLDGEMIPKISDFGMARIFGRDQTEASTKKVVGTYGYMSPEYAMDGLFSVKSDVFSFGVLVLEIVSGKRNRGFYHSNSELNLLGHAWRLWKEGKGLELMDQTIGESYSGQEILRCIQVGLLCVQERAEERPKMSTVVLMLSSETASVPQPKTPGFCVGRQNLETDSSSSKQDEDFSLNHLTMTMPDAR